MTTKIKRTSDFPKTVTVDDLESQQNLDAQTDEGVFDDVEKDIAGAGRQAFDKIEVGGGATLANAPGLSLGQIMSELQTDESALKADPRALENYSTAPCKEAPVVFSESQKTRIQQLGSYDATINSPKAMNIAETPLERRRQMEREIKEASHDLPIPDVTTFAEGRKITMPAEIIIQANKVTKKKAMTVLEKIVGKELTAKVVLCARTGGVTFFQKPHLWLGQRLFFEGSKRHIWDKVEPIKDYDASLDGSHEAVVPKALATLFSWEPVDQLMVISKINQINIIHAAKIMINRVCDIAIEERKPKDYKEEYDDSQTLEQLVGTT